MIDTINFENCLKSERMWY